MRVLVVGGTGTVGSQVARELVERGVEVDVLTRDATKPVAAGARAVAGDLLDPASVRVQFPGHDGLFLINGLSPSESQEGLMALCGARLAGVRRIVYSSVLHADHAPQLPHFGAKLGIEAAVRASGVEWTILRPASYFQNNLRYREAMLAHGVYPQPLGGAGVSCVDVRDLAAAAAIALTESGHDGEIYDLVGPELLTGTEVAAIWSRALGRPIAYIGDDMEAWEAMMRQMLPAWLAFELRLMYEQFQRHGLPATAVEVARVTALLGRPPRALAEFARETAAAWAS